VFFQIVQVFRVELVRIEFIPVYILVIDILISPILAEQLGLVALQAIEQLLAVRFDVL